MLGSLVSISTSEAESYLYDTLICLLFVVFFMWMYLWNSELVPPRYQCFNFLIIYCHLLSYRLFTVKNQSYIYIYIYINLKNASVSSSIPCTLILHRFILNYWLRNGLNSLGRNTYLVKELFWLFKLGGNLWTKID